MGLDSDNDTEKRDDKSCKDDKVYEKILNLKPPDMIKDGNDLDVYKSRLHRWSRLSNLTPQSQFDLVII